LDGSIHNETLVRENDLNRQAEIEALGIKVLRFKNMDVILNISKVITEIREMA
jgi:imidazole glycerol-phosphate synthase subunit HisF